MPAPASLGLKATRAAVLASARPPEEQANSPGGSRPPHRVPEPLTHRGPHSGQQSTQRSHSGPIHPHHAHPHEHSHSHSPSARPPYDGGAPWGQRATPTLPLALPSPSVEPEIPKRAGGGVRHPPKHGAPLSTRHSLPAGLRVPPGPHPVNTVSQSAERPFHSSHAPCPPVRRVSSLPGPGGLRPPSLPAPPCEFPPQSIHGPRSGFPRDRSASPPRSQPTQGQRLALPGGAPKLPGFKSAPSATGSQLEASHGEVLVVGHEDVHVVTTEQRTLLRKPSRGLAGPDSPGSRRARERSPPNGRRRTQPPAGGSPQPPSPFCRSQSPGQRSLGALEESILAENDRALALQLQEEEEVLGDASTPRNNNNNCSSCNSSKPQPIYQPQPSIPDHPPSPPSAFTKASTAASAPFPASGPGLRKAPRRRHSSPGQASGAGATNPTIRVVRQPPSPSLPLHPSGGRGGGEEGAGKGGEGQTGLEKGDRLGGSPGGQSTCLKCQEPLDLRGDVGELAHSPAKRNERPLGCYLGRCTGLYCGPCLRRHTYKHASRGVEAGDAALLGAFPCPCAEGQGGTGCTGGLSRTEAQTLLPERLYRQLENLEVQLAMGGSLIACPNCELMVEHVTSPEHTEPSRPQGASSGLRSPSAPPPSSARRGREREGNGGGEVGAFGSIAQAVRRFRSRSSRRAASEERRRAEAAELQIEGKEVSREAFEHHNSYRMRCRGCGTDFCASCKCTPYHLGSTCQQHEERKQMSSCRFCEAALGREGTPHPPGDLPQAAAPRPRGFFRRFASAPVAEPPQSPHPLPRNVCEAVECKERAKIVCTHTLKCGHPCGGVGLPNTSTLPPPPGMEWVDENVKRAERGDRRGGSGGGKGGKGQRERRRSSGDRQPLVGDRDRKGGKECICYPPLRVHHPWKRDTDGERLRRKSQSGPEGGVECACCHANSGTSPNGGGCPPCLHADCAAAATETCGQSGEDWCSICFSEALSAAPCVRLGCGHVFHYHCVKAKLDNRWPADRITFGFLGCPTCGSEMHHPSLEAQISAYASLRADIARRSTLRMRHEGLEGAKELGDPHSRFYNQPQLFAEARLCYYMCSKCQRPYFGGMANCEDGLRPPGEDGRAQSDELVCGACASGAAKACSIHGSDFIEYKCKFCCSVAAFFCWGSTHFCKECHKRQESGDYMTKKPRSSLSVCMGKDTCPLRIDHPPNGEEFALGCTLCRKSVDE